MSSGKKKKRADGAAPPREPPNTLARTMRSMMESDACTKFNIQVDESDMRKIKVTMPSVTFLDDYPELFKELEGWAGKTGADSSIVYEIWFGSSFPRAPPFARVVRPRLKFRTGHITVGGSVCTELLTLQGWRPELSGENLILFLHNLLIDGGAQVDNSTLLGDYTYEEAHAAYTRVARFHGWKVEH